MYHILKILLLGICLILISNLSLAQPYGSAVVLDGSSNFISVPDNSVLNITDNLTLEAWIKPCDLNGHKMIFSKLWCIGAQNAYYLGVINGTLRWQWSLSGCSSLENLFESDLPVIQENVWQHVAVVHTPTGVTLYLNGVPIAASLTQGSFSKLKVSNEPLRIGTYKNISGAYTLFFNGLIDEARVWNTNLNSTDILSRHNSPLVGNEPNLIAYYNMNILGNGNGITVPNMATVTGSVLNGSTIGSGSWPFFSSGLPKPDLGNDTTICVVTTLLLDVTEPNASYLWQDNSVQPTFSVSQTGTYSVDLSVIPGCFNSDTVSVTLLTPPIVNLGNDTIMCQQSSWNLDASFSGATYLWQDNSTSPTYTVNQSGLYWVQVDLNGCTASDSIEIILGSPSVSFGLDTTLCDTDRVILIATNLQSSYLWQDGSTQSTYTATQTGVYWVEVTNPCTTISDTIAVKISDLKNLDLGNDDIICHGDTIKLNANFSGATFRWQDSSKASDFYVTQFGLYWVEVSEDGCKVSDTIEFNQGDPKLTLGNDTLLCDRVTYTLEVYAPEASYLWQDGTNWAYYPVQDSGLYWVQVTNVCGSQYDSIIVDLEDCDCNFFIPNAFHPNSNDLNEIFKPETICEYKNYQFQIFDRWGMSVFETIDIEEGWNGKVNNEYAAQTIYAYIIRFYFKGDERVIIGNVLLIR